MPEDIEEVNDGLEVKEQKGTLDKTTDTGTNNNYTRILIKTAKIVTFTKLDVKAAQNATTEQLPNTSDNLPSAEIKPCLDSGSGNAASVKPLTKVMQQRQAIKAGIVSAALLVVVGLDGIAGICLALYNTLKTNMNLEIVEDIKQPKC
jgi:hypothetical protein